MYVHLSDAYSRHSRCCINPDAQASAHMQCLFGLSTYCHEQAAYIGMQSCRMELAQSYTIQHGMFQDCQHPGLCLIQIVYPCARICLRSLPQVELHGQNCTTMM